MLFLLLTILLVLAAVYVPGYVGVRLLGGSRPLALALAPALAGAIAGIGAILAALLGVRWGLPTYLASSTLLALLGWGLARFGLRLPTTVLDGPLIPHSPTSSGAALHWAPLWLVGAAAIALAPIARQAARPDAVLERWDTLYHLSALQRVRETSDASSLHLGAISNSALEPTFYPAAFHALAGIVPWGSTPVVLNGTVLALAVVPWALGIALLARTVLPQVSWAPFAAALAALLIPATPWNLWIHLSPIPNLSAFAALPGTLAAAAALWGALLPRPRWRSTVAAGLVVGAAGLGLGLLHPNVAVTALILLVVLTAVTALPHLRTTPLLAAVPLLAALAVLAVVYSPLGAHVTGFDGGLRIPLWRAFMEVGLGLLTVWPMALGVVLAALWWPGLIRCLRTAPLRWVGIAWLVIAVIYLDAALDSPLNLSAIYYRGQDRVSMPLAMLSCVLVVPGLQVWSRLLPERTPQGPPRALRPLTIGLVLAAVLLALGSIPARDDNAAKNLAAHYPGRGRFLQTDERALFEEHVPQMDSAATVLASPFSGAAHLYALYGQDVRLPVAGMAYSDLDRELIYATEDAAYNPASCQLLQDHGIRYVYQERLPYAHHRTSDSVNLAGPELGRVLFETEHSRMIEVDCDAD